MISELSFKLLDLIKVGHINMSNDEVETKQINQGSTEHIPVILTLDNISDFKSYAYNPKIGCNQLHTIEHNNKKYFFEEDGKELLNKTLIIVLTLNSFKHSCSYRALELQIYYWLIDVKETNQIKLELLSYLEFEIEKLKKSYTIEFPITNFHIEHPFTIGDVTIDYYTKDKFSEIWKEIPSSKTDLEGFLKLNEKFVGRVFASYTVFAEHEKAMDIAYEKTAEAIDVLKLFTPVILYPSAVCVIDLDKRLKYNFSSQSITRANRYFTTNYSANHSPLYFMRDSVKYAVDYGVEIFSKFLIDDKASSLNNIIHHSIKLFADAVSTQDLHFRSTLLISCIECLLLKDSREGDMTKKTKNRFLKIIKKYSNIHSKETIEQSIIHVYNLRHETIHKGLKSPIDLTLYAYVQFFTRLMILIIIKEFNQFVDKETMIDAIDSFPIPSDNV